MDNIRAIILVIGVLLGIYCIYKGFEKVRSEGIRFNFVDFFKNVPFRDIKSGNLILGGLFCFISVIMLYGIWHRWHW